MRVSREQAAKNRERVLEAASRLFRERGFDGVGVAELMRAAGLTHGGGTSRACFSRIALGRYAASAPAYRPCGRFGLARRD